MARIRFLKPCWNPVIGAVDTDDMAEVSEGMAHHLVQEAGVAEFVTVAQAQVARAADFPGHQPAADAPADPPADAAPRARRGKK
jgi:hypothetical protein